MNPLEMAKLRMQVERAGRANGVRVFGYKHLVDGLEQIVRKEGWMALGKGSAAKVLYAAPNTAICMGLAEYFKGQLSQRQDL